MNRRLLVGLTILMVLVASIAAGGAGASPSAKQSSAAQSKTIAIVFPNSSNPIVQIVLNAAKKQAKLRGYKVLVNDPGADLSKQVSVTQSYISQKVAAIVSVVPEPKLFERVAAQARKAGVVWVTYADRLKNEDATVTWPHYEGGYILGRSAANFINAHGGNSEVALLTYQSGSWARSRAKGMEDALKKFAPGAKIVVRQDALDAPTGLKVISTSLQAHPKLSVVLGIVDTATEGAYQAFTANGAKANDPNLFVGGLDGSKRAYQLILGKTFYRGSAALQLSAIGRAVVDVPVNAVEGGKARDAIIPYTLLTSGTPTLVRSYLTDWK